jgi:pre-mRNA-splicing factor SYF1
MLIEFEQVLLRDPKSLRAWISYLENCQGKDAIQVYERALSILPGSFKLWKKYLDFRLRRLLEFPDQSAKTNVKYAVIHKIKDMLDYQVLVPFDDPEWRITEILFQKALIYCHKFPIIWAMYAVFMIKQDHFITQTRRVLDSSLQALPLTQHPMMWILYLVRIYS